MWTNLESHSASIENVFEPLRQEAAQFQHAWSIAELRLSENDIRWLRSWFDCLTPDSTENWLKSVVFAKYDGEVFMMNLEEPHHLDLQDNLFSPSGLSGFILELVY